MQAASKHILGKKELKCWQSFLGGSSQQPFITNTWLWSWQLSFHSGGAGKVCHGETGKTIEKRVLFVSWVDCLLLGMPPGSQSFPALKLQGNKSLSSEQTRERPQNSRMRPTRSSNLAVMVASMWPGGLQPLAGVGGWGVSTRPREEEGDVREVFDFRACEQDGHLWRNGCLEADAPGKGNLESTRRGKPEEGRGQRSRGQSKTLECRTRERGRVSNGHKTMRNSPSAKSKNRRRDSGGWGERSPQRTDEVSCSPGRLTLILRTVPWFLCVEFNPSNLSQVTHLLALVHVWHSNWCRDRWECTRASEKHHDFCWDLRPARFSLDVRLRKSGYWRDCICVGTVTGEGFCFRFDYPFKHLPSPPPSQPPYLPKRTMLLHCEDTGLTMWLACGWAALQFGLGHVTCFGRWDVSRWNKNRGMECACAVGLLCAFTTAIRRTPQSSGYPPTAQPQDESPACVEKPSSNGPPCEVEPPRI